MLCTYLAVALENKGRYHSVADNLAPMYAAKPYLHEGPAKRDRRAGRGLQRNAVVDLGPNSAGIGVPKAAHTGGHGP